MGPGAFSSFTRLRVQCAAEPCQARCALPHGMSDTARPTFGQVDMLGLRYKSVYFGAGKSLASPNRCAHARRLYGAQRAVDPCQAGFVSRSPTPALPTVWGRRGRRARDLLSAEPPAHSRTVPSSASLGLADYCHVDMLGVWYNFVNFGQRAAAPCPAKPSLLQLLLLPYYSHA